MKKPTMVLTINGEDGSPMDVYSGEWVPKADYDAMCDLVDGGDDARIEVERLRAAMDCEGDRTSGAFNMLRKQVECIREKCLDNAAEFKDSTTTTDRAEARLCKVIIGLIDLAKRDATEDPR